MNKLIIVGNGFDIHNGLSTKYSDFLKWLIKRAINTIEEDDLLDNLIRIDITPINDKYSNNAPKYAHIDEVIDFILDYSIEFPKEGIFCYLKDKFLNYKIKNISEFFKTLLTHQLQKNWVDIEMMYYKELKRCLKLMQIEDKIQEAEIKLESINKELNVLKKYLVIYLSKILEARQKVNYDFDYSADSDINVDIIKEKHHIKNLLDEDFTDDNKKYIKPKEVCFLNFNYTGLPYDLNRRNYQHINIHGSLRGENLPVFGFGDEIDADYLEMEKTNINEFFTHIKSFEYFKNSNYSKLMEFINCDSYVVYIWGHSCGLSDRTLLNMIFEHDNCAAIKPYFWKKSDGTNNYTEITHNISRHFKNKLKMRNRVVSFDKCSALGSQH